MLSEKVEVDKGKNRSYPLAVLYTEIRYKELDTIYKKKKDKLQQLITSFTVNMGLCVCLQVLYKTLLLVFKYGIMGKNLACYQVP